MDIGENKKSHQIPGNHNSQSNSYLLLCNELSQNTVA